MLTIEVGQNPRFQTNLKTPIALRTKEDDEYDNLIAAEIRRKQTDSMNIIRLGKSWEMSLFLAQIMAVAMIDWLKLYCMETLLLGNQI